VCFVSNLAGKLVLFKTRVFGGGGGRFLRSPGAGYYGGSRVSLREMRVPVRAFSQYVRVLLMPQLSPTMQTGRIDAIHLTVGQKIKAYDLALQVSTKELTSVVVEGKEADNTILVEVVEDDMTCKAILANVGDELKTGEPIAVFADDDAVDLPTEFSKDSVRTKKYIPALWQGYVSSKNSSGACGCS